MEAKDAIKKLEEYPAFKEFIKINKDSYLTHAFAMIDDALSSSTLTDWQIGFYDDKKDRITVFNVGEQIIQSPESEVFKKEKKIKKLDLKKVKLNHTEAMEKVDQYKKEKYPNEIITKKILILQNIQEGTVWNITYISSAFNVLNVKIDAEDGKILHTSFENLMMWKKK